MKFSLTIRMDNEAFGDEPEPELTVILSRLAAGFHPAGGQVSGNAGSSGHVNDSNGNRVGAWSIR